MATVFDKLNQVYKEYLEAEQAYAVVSRVLGHNVSLSAGDVSIRDGLCLQAMESGASRGGTAQRRPVRTQAVIDQSDMYTHVLSSFTERKVCEHTMTEAAHTDCFHFDIFQKSKEYGGPKVPK